MAVIDVDAGPSPVPAPRPAAARETAPIAAGEEAGPSRMPSVQVPDVIDDAEAGPSRAPVVSSPRVAAAPKKKVAPLFKPNNFSCKLIFNLIINARSNYPSSIKMLLHNKKQLLFKLFLKLELSRRSS